MVRIRSTWPLRGGLEICAGCWRCPRHAVDAELAAGEARDGQREPCAQRFSATATRTSSSRRRVRARRSSRSHRALCRSAVAAAANAVAEAANAVAVAASVNAAMVVVVNVKWGKQKFEGVEVDVGEPVAVFKAQLFAHDERAAGAAEGDGRQGRAAQGRRRSVRSGSQAEPEPDADGDGGRAARAAARAHGLRRGPAGGGAQGEGGGRRGAAGRPRQPREHVLPQLDAAVHEDHPRALDLAPEVFGRGRGAGEGVCVRDARPDDAARPRERGAGGDADLVRQRLPRLVPRVRRADAEQRAVEAAGRAGSAGRPSSTPWASRWSSPPPSTPPPTCRRRRRRCCRGWRRCVPTSATCSSASRPRRPYVC